MLEDIKDLSENRIKLITWTLLCIMPIMGMVVDLVAPSLPAIANSLKVSNGIAKDVITMYLIGYAIGNFVTGFLTDAWGRKYLLRVFLLGFVVSSLLPTIFPRIEVLLVARFLQGFTIGAASILARAVFSDILPGDKKVHLGALIGTMWGLGPVFGPVIGGYLQFYFGWKSCFYFLAAITAICFVATYFIVPETSTKRHPLEVGVIARNISEVISHKSFMALPILMGVSYALIIVFHTSGPFLVQNILGHSSVFFGHLALSMGVSFLLATFLCRYLLTIYPVDRIYLIVITTAFIVTAVGVGIAYFANKSIIIMVIVSGLMFVTSGILYPMSMGKGLSYFGHIAGTASAIMYLINGCIISLVSFMMSFIEIDSVIPIMWVFFVLILICCVVYLTMIHKSLKTT